MIPTLRDVVVFAEHPGHVNVTANTGNEAPLHFGMTYAVALELHRQLTEVLGLRHPRPTHPLTASVPNPQEIHRASQ